MSDSTPPQADMLTFLASSVHDMKNSVSMLIGGLHKTLSANDPITFAGYDDLTQMTYEAERINANLVQLLTLYKLGEELYPFDPKEISVQEFLQQVAGQSGRWIESRHVALEVVCPDDLLGFFDEDLVGSVIGNAFSNAVRYTKDRVRLSAQMVGDFLEIAIDDNGRGYTPAMLEQGRQAAAHSSFDGSSTGLGLYFSAAIANLHGNRGRRGELHLENTGALGGGRFILRLP